MLTSKSISTIHYADTGQLKVKLDDMVEKNKLSFYAFIKHIKESDETKDHIHLFIVPNGKVNTDQLRSELEFLDSKNPTMPIRSLPFEPSKFADWYLYCLHDKSYLASKQQTREFHYQRDEYFVSDEDYFNELIHKIDFTKFKTQSLVVDAAENHVPFVDLVKNGVIPAPLFVQYQKVYDLVYENVLYRQKFTHDNVDPETGEIISSDEDVPAESDPDDLPFY